MSDELESLDPYVQWIASEARRPVVVDPSARVRLMDAIRAEPRPERQPRVLRWVLEPRSITLPPLATAALAAGLVAFGILGGLALNNRDGRSSTDQRLAEVAGDPRLPASSTPRVVKFVLIAPKAARVSVVGDFNDWNAGATPMTNQGTDGAWTVFVPLEPGLHTYSFVIDGTHFVPDPTAPVAPDDGYGHQSSVVVVRGSAS
jgi:hypothetical protein